MVFTKKRVSVSTVRLNTHYGLLGSIDVARQIGADAVDFDLSCFNYKNRDSIYSKCQDEFVSFFESVNAFIDELKHYIDYYNNERISLKLKGMSPVQYRTHSLAI